MTSPIPHPLRWCLIAAVVVVLAAVFAGGCNDHHVTTPAGQTVRVAAIVPLTGWSAEFGNHEWNALQVAVEHARARHPDAKIEAQVEDTRSETKGALAATQKLLAGPLPGMVLIESSGASLAVAPLLDPKKILMLSVSANPEVTKQSEWIFRSFPTADEESHLILDFAVHEKRATSIGLLYINNDYGQSYEKPFREIASQLNASITFAEPFAEDTRDFRPIVERMKTANPEALFIVGYGSAMGLLIKAVREVQYSGILMACSSVIYEDVTSVAGDAVKGVIFADIPFRLSSDDPRAAKFKEDYSKRAGKSPSPLAAMTYDSATMLIESLVEADGDTTKARDAILAKSEFDGINGRIGVPKSRDLQFALTVKTVE